MPRNIVFAGKTLGGLRRSSGFDEARLLRSVRTEIRENLLSAIEAGRRLFPGIHGYDDTVIPQVVNALLSQHHFILLGLRGQAKSRLLRDLIQFLDPQMPAIAGCEIRDNPLRPLCARCRKLVVEAGDDLQLEMILPEQRYVEKLATPDVTVADLIGDVDPIRAVHGGHNLADEQAIHFGLLPRAHRGVFAINELPDLAGKIQVALFNVMQEGDIQIKGFPVRLPLDLLLAFSANPEDYTARGKIVTPLKDRIGSEIRTHYPATLSEGMAITQQEACTSRGGEIVIPDFVREVAEGIAFAAREDKRVDRRSGVSQRLPITCLEIAVSNAERRERNSRQRPIVVRISDVHRAMPALTGKIELEYEGEMRGAETVATDLVRLAVARAFDLHFADADLKPVVQWFDLGGTLQVDQDGTAAEAWRALEAVTGISGFLGAIPPPEPPMAKTPAWRGAVAEFLLEGLCAHRRISRDAEHGYQAVPIVRPGSGAERKVTRDPSRSYN